MIIEREENHYIVNDLQGDEQREKLREIITNYQLPLAPVRHYRSVLVKCLQMALFQVFSVKTEVLL